MFADIPLIYFQEIALSCSSGLISRLAIRFGSRTQELSSIPLLAERLEELEDREALWALKSLKQNNNKSFFHKQKSSSGSQALRIVAPEPVERDR